MKIILSQKTTLEGICHHLTQLLPQYTITVKKMAFNSVVEVKKSGWVGVWITYKEKKDRITIAGCIPSPVNRVLFGGLLLVIINAFVTRKLIAEVGEAINNNSGSDIFGM